jgi:hypothetical protein
MKKTLQQLNKLLELGFIKKYAIAGGIAHFYYIEPSVTYDLDLIINIPNNGNNPAPLSEIYKWAQENNYVTEGEHIVIEGVPVQFLLPYNDLVIEALENSFEIYLFEERSFIIGAEYLMAIMIQTGRASDKERLIKFINNAEYNEGKFIEILTRFELTNEFNDFKKRYFE